MLSPTIHYPLRVNPPLPSNPPSRPAPRTPPFHPPCALPAARRLRRDTPRDGAAPRARGSRWSYRRGRTGPRPPTASAAPWSTASPARESRPPAEPAQVRTSAWRPGTRPSQAPSLPMEWDADAAACGTPAAPATAMRCNGVPVAIMPLATRCAATALRVKRQCGATKAPEGVPRLG